MEKRAVCLNCIDGRVQVPVIEALKERYQVDYVDMVTYPGMDGFVSKSESDINTLVNNVRISIEKNQASVLCVVGHYDCKGNPVSDEQHKKDVAQGLEAFKGHFPDMEFAPLWINEQWKGEFL